MTIDTNASSPHAPKVTIGLPVYNGENYLEEAICSLLAQTFTDFELIISDNASSDRTRSICEAFAAADERVRYSRLNENLGAAANYNRILPTARGAYFKWAAHDDRCKPDYLKTCIDALDSQPAAVLAYPATAVIDENGGVMRTYRDGLDLPQASAHARFGGYVRGNFLHRRGMCNPIFGLMRTEALRSTRLIQDFIASDRSLLGHLSLLGNFIEIDEVLFERRVHMGTSTLAITDFEKRREWFTPTTIRPPRRRSKRNNFMALRMTHLKDFYRAIDELVPQAAERRACRQTLTRLLLTEPKWFYRDIKYSLGGQPKPAALLAKMRSAQA